MQIEGPHRSTNPVDFGGAGKTPRNPEAAARQFEEVLVKQMMHTMTKNLFGSGLAGEDGPQWTGTYGEMQSDVLSTELARQFTKSGKLGIAELLLKQWKREGFLESSPQDATSPIEPSTIEAGSIHPYTEA